jgi:AraC family transcriptional regulator
LPNNCVDERIAWYPISEISRASKMTMNPERGWYGQRLAATHSLDAAPSLILKTSRKASVAVTRMRSNTGMTEASTPLSADKALTVHLQLRELRKHEVWIERRCVYAEPYQRGAVTIIDLQQSSFAYVPNPFDALNFYVPMTALNEYGYSEGLPKIDTVDCSFGKSDPVIEHLGGALLPFLNQEELPSRLFLEQVQQALCAHLIANFAGTRAAIPQSRGGLAPWQKRRAEEILNANLLGDISLADVAAQCNLSAGHFARAFKRSFGTTPHRWLEQRRIEKVKDLLLHSRLALEDIAVACGFGDASSLIRVFHRVSGTSPGEWRRSC